jgi:hypothetical protein
MEWLLDVLPTKPQPISVRYATTAMVMAFCMAVQIGLSNQTGFVGLLFLLLGVFATGLMFDRVSALFAVALGLRSRIIPLAKPYRLPAPWRPARCLLPLGSSLGLSLRHFGRRWKKPFEPRKQKLCSLWS